MDKKTVSADAQRIAEAIEGLGCEISSLSREVSELRAAVLNIGGGMEEVANQAAMVVARNIGNAVADAAKQIAKEKGKCPK